MSCGSLSAVGIGNSVMVFGLAGVIRPTWLPVISTNQRLPSGPAVMPAGRMSADDTGNSVMVFGAAGRIRPTLPGSNSVNQRFASGPAVMPSGKLNGDARNSVKHCPCAVPAATSRVTANAARRAPRRFMAASLVNPRSTRQGPPDAYREAVHPLDDVHSIETQQFDDPIAGIGMASADHSRTCPIPGRHRGASSTAGA